MTPARNPPTPDRKWPVLVAGVILVTFLGFLVAVTSIAQHDFRQSYSAQQQLDLEIRASALSYFFHERMKDLQAIAKDPAFEAFYANEALGMSMEYGLRASLARLERTLIQREQSLGLEGHPAFSRIVLIQRGGEPLVDTRPEQAPFWLDIDLESQYPDQPRFVAHHHAIFLLLRQWRAGHPQGWLFAQINLDDAFRKLVYDEHMHGATRILLVANDDMKNLDATPARHREWSLTPGNSDTDFRSNNGTGAEPIRIKASVASTPFALVALHEPEGLAGYLTSHWLPIQLTLLSAMVLAVIGFANYTQRQSLVLRGRMEESRHQGEILEKQNVRLQAEIQMREAYEKRLSVQANYDNLTGLPNRSLALDRLSQALLQQERHDTGMAVILLDLDRFKKVNDSLGHDIGDKLLVEVGTRLQGAMRGGDTVARLGGDEFLILLPEVENHGVIEQVCRKVLLLFQRPFVVGHHEFEISTSLGISVAPHDGRKAEVLLKNADIALYSAKELDKGGFRFFTTEMSENLKRRQTMEDLLTHALERREFHIVYQPIIRIFDGAIVGAEALLRWHSPILGDIPPDRFISLCEDLGIINEIGGWLLSEACREAAKWRRYGTFDLAVNVSSLQLKDPNGFLDLVRTELEDSGLPAANLNLEITESVLLEDSDGVWKMLQQLDRLGVRLSIDDFGTGYSSLSYLRRLPFDTLKIDRSFVNDLPDDPGSVALARAILALAHAMNMEVIAEGIENAAQLAFFQGENCHCAQGYLFHKPMTAWALTDLVSSHPPQLATPPPLRRSG